MRFQFASYILALALFAGGCGGSSSGSSGSAPVSSVDEFEELRISPNFDLNDRQSVRLQLSVLDESGQGIPKALVTVSQPGNATQGERVLRKYVTDSAGAIDTQLLVSRSATELKMEVNAIGFVNEEIQSIQGQGVSFTFQR